MKPLNLAAVILASIAIGVLATPRVVALAQPVRDLKNAAVECGSTGDPEVINLPMSAACLQNVSTTCVRIGGEAVTTATGLSIGDGCPGGMVFCGDFSRAWCEAESSAITIQVVYGSN